MERNKKLLKNHLIYTRVVSRERARELDKLAEEIYSIQTILLMENAGRAVAEECIELAEKLGLENFLVVAGSGNNGGDGFCAARHIKNAGFHVEIALVQDEDKIKGDALKNLTIAKKMRIPIHRLKKLEELNELLERTDITIDAIFGTGITKDIEDEFIVSVIEQINQWRWGGKEKKTDEKATKNTGVSNMKFTNRRIVSVDIPSGLDANTGKPRNVSIKADITVTFAPSKVGLFIGDFDRVGELKVHDIGIPAELWENSEMNIISLDMIKHIIKPRHPLSHKGDFGHILCIAGGLGRAGAAILCGKAAVRAGTGLVTLMVPEPVYEIVASGAREFMVFPAPAKGRSFAENSKELFDELVLGKTAVLIGPGIWTYPDVAELLLHVIDVVKERKIPILLDADALNLLSEIQPYVLHGAKAVITPHPGEAARIIGLTPQDISKDRIRYALELSNVTRSVCVLKGARTIVTDGKNIFINTTGGVELATGGTGDVLAGIIGGFLAQGYSEFESALIGVFAHGIAGELAKKEGFPLSPADQVCEKIQDALSYILSSDG